MHPNVHCSTIYNIQVMEAPKCPSIEEWIKKIWYIYTVEYYSAIKKRNDAICSNMGGPRDYHTKWSKSDSGRQISYDITHMWTLILKKRYKWTYLQNRNRLTDIENKHMVTKGETWCRGINQEHGINIHTLLYIR